MSLFKNGTEFSYTFLSIRKQLSWNLLTPCTCVCVCVCKCDSGVRGYIVMALTSHFVLSFYWLSNQNTLYKFALYAQKQPLSYDDECCEYCNNLASLTGIDQAVTHNSLLSVCVFFIVSCCMLCFTHNKDFCVLVCHCVVQHI